MHLVVQVQQTERKKAFIYIGLNILAPDKQVAFFFFLPKSDQKAISQKAEMSGCGEGSLNKAYLKGREETELFSDCAMLSPV